MVISRNISILTSCPDMWKYKPAEYILFWKHLIHKRANDMEPAVFPFHLKCFGVAVTFLASNNKNKIPILVSQKPLEKQMQKKQNKFISFFYRLLC